MLHGFIYLVDWGNGFIGGYDKSFEQIFNTPRKSVFDDLKRLNISECKIITPEELNRLRKSMPPWMNKYLGII